MQKVLRALGLSRRKTGMRITVGTGFYADKTSRQKATSFLALWDKTNIRPLENPEVIVVDTSEPGCSPRWKKYGYQVIRSDRNPGTWRKIWGYEDPALDAPNLCGWTLSWMIPALTAYTRYSDFVYVEQDCLCGGPWLKSLKHHANSTGLKALTGKSNSMRVEQSLFYIDRAFIPWFIGLYLQYPGEGQMLCEDKFAYMMARYPKLIGFHNVGPGRDRPIPKDGAVSAQHLDDDDIRLITRQRS